jgi:alpha-glucosidase
MFDFGYDVSDYLAVEPLFGSIEDLDRLIDAVHVHGMRLILDLVPNHTSHRHAWFQSSRRSRQSAHRDWYVWRDAAPDGGPPNNWPSSFGGPAWTWDETTGQYYLHSFLPEQPDLNYRNPAVQRALEEVIAFWLDRCIDGFRVDVIHKMVKDAELRSNPTPDPNVHPMSNVFGQHHLYDEDRPEVHEVIRSWRRLLDRYVDRMMVGEVYLFDPERIARYYGNGGDELHLAFNFRFQWSPWEAGEFRARIDEMERLLPRGAQPTYVLSSHDAPRHRSRFDDPKFGEARARLAALMLLTLSGTPFLYYGEEIGMRNVPIPEDRIQDPVGRRLPGLGRDPERTPMQWSAEKNAGFSTGAPWLPIADDYAECNVARQLDDPGSLLSFYRKVIWFRKTAPALLRGTYRAVESAMDTLVYLREDGAQRLVIALNFANEARRTPFPSSATGSIDFSTQLARRGSVRDVIDLAPCEGVVISLQP